MYISVIKKYILYLCVICLFQCIAARPGCTVSAASIVYHVAQLLEEDFAKNIFILSALPYVARSCLGQQYNMRLYNQASKVQQARLSKADRSISLLFHTLFRILRGITYFDYFLYSLS